MKTIICMSFIPHQIEPLPVEPPAPIDPPATIDPRASIEQPANVEESQQLIESLVKCRKCFKLQTYNSLHL